MARTRLSTTVDKTLLADARSANPQHNDAALLDAALASLLARTPAAAIDDGYRAYDELPSMNPTTGATWNRSDPQPRPHEFLAGTRRTVVV